MSLDGKCHSCRAMCRRHINIHNSYIKTSAVANWIQNDTKKTIIVVTVIRVMHEEAQYASCLIF